ncbi:TIGR03435 family protein [Terriglobus albidus]|uniref:TIGR03435 family protein n=1 Tax=Terriglobus albidus TaxID=1592106 RepID=UPI001FE9305C|nr:TIGR03435 family protein [Terriglobus albidus]
MTSPSQERHKKNEHIRQSCRLHSAPARRHQLRSSVTKGHADLIWSYAKQLRYACLLLSGALTLPLSAQSAPRPPAWQIEAGGKASFEVASIKPSSPDAPSPSNVPIGPQVNFTPTGGLFTADATVERYIYFAYKLFLTPSQKDALMATLPKWVTNQRFVIKARAQGDPTKDQYRLMMQSLLAERFKLAVHFEPKRLPVFALGFVKEGRFGPYLRLHTAGPSCNVPAAPDGSPAHATSEKPINGTPEYPFWCGGETAIVLSPRLAEWGIRDSTMAYLAADLPGLPPTPFDRPIVDETGVKEKIDFALVWNWHPSADQATETTPEAQRDPREVSMEEALRDQLGLKLRPTEAVIDTFVIDHIELPSEN